jgi:hypothetical protein
MQTARAFGVGCFHFGYKKEVPYTFHTGEYISDLRSALSELPSVTEVKIDYDVNMEDTYLVEEAYLGLDGREVFPFVYFLRVQFSVYIPFRVQAALINVPEEALRTETEHFSVYLINAYQGPVVFIEGRGAGAGSDPSTFVQVVREFLEKEFTRTKGGVVFDFVGPSPFHADFFLVGSTETRGLSCERLPMRGYDQLVFKYGGENDVPSDDDLHMLFHELTPELGVFYSIERRNVSFMRKWHQLVGSWEELRELVEGKYHFLNLRHRSRIHQGSKQLISNAFSLLVELDLAKKETDAEIASTYDKQAAAYFEDYVRSNSKGELNYPVESILDWSKYQNEASFKQAEIAALVIAASLGGMVGAAVTVAFT